MCYVGCPYESRWGDTIGECRLPCGAPKPDDAGCVLLEQRIEEQRRKHPVKSLVEDARYKLAYLKWRMSRKSEVPF